MAGANVSGTVALPSIHGDGMITTNKPKAQTQQPKAAKQSTITQKAAKASARKKVQKKVQKVQGPSATQELPPIAKSIVIGAKKKGRTSKYNTSPKKTYGSSPKKTYGSSYNSSSKKKANTYRSAAKRDQEGEFEDDLRSECRPIDAGDSTEKVKPIE